MSATSLAARPHRPCTARPAGPGLLVNDLHSRLNSTRVRDLRRDVVLAAEDRDVVEP